MKFQKKCFHFEKYKGILSIILVQYSSAPSIVDIWKLKEGSKYIFDFLNYSPVKIMFASPFIYDWILNNVSHYASNILKFLSPYLF